MLIIVCKDCNVCLFVDFKGKIFVFVDFSFIFGYLFFKIGMICVGFNFDKDLCVIFVGSYDVSVIVV